MYTPTNIKPFPLPLREKNCGRSTDERVKPVKYTGVAAVHGLKIAAATADS